MRVSARASLRSIVVLTVVALGISTLPARSAIAFHSTPAGPPTTTHNVQPVVVADNPPCPAGLVELKVNNASSGTFNNGTLFVTVVVTDTPDGPVFSFTAKDAADNPFGIDVVIAKGGPDGNVYTYDPPTERASDTFLHSPVNPSNHKFFGLSHLSFCYDTEVGAPAFQLIKEVDTDGDDDYDNPDDADFDEPAVQVGDTVDYRIRITNVGTAAGSLDQPLIDDFDGAHLDIGTINAGDSTGPDATVPGVEDPADDKIRWGTAGVGNVFQFEVGEVWTFTYDAVVEGTFSGTPPTNAAPCIPENNEYPVDNTATIETLSDDARICVIAQPELTMEKDVEVGDGSPNDANVPDFNDHGETVAVGDTITYRIRVTNNGDVPGSVDAVIDNYDEAAITPEPLADMDPDGTDDSGSVITWDAPGVYGPIAPNGGTFDFIYQAEVTAKPTVLPNEDRCGVGSTEYPAINSATTTGPALGPDTALVCITEPALAMQKDVDVDGDGFDDHGATVSVGDVIRYRIRVINNGDAPGSVDEVHDNYDETAINPGDTVTAMEPDASLDDGSFIHWTDGPYGPVPAKVGNIPGTFDFIYEAEVTAAPLTNVPNNPCEEGAEYPALNLATVDNLPPDNALVCVELPGRVVVNKTEGLPAGALTRNFDFELRGGPQGAGTPLPGTATNGDPQVSFDDLVPGAGYVLCEVNIPAGYDSTLTPDLPGVDAEECSAPFTVSAGAANASVFNVNNIPCPEGGTITIQKTIPAGSAPATFRYTLDIPGNSDPSIDLEFTGNETVENGVLNTPPGMVGPSFTLTETELGGSDKFQPNAARQVAIQPPDCGGIETYDAAFAPTASARVIKTEEPVRGQRRNAIGKWTFTLTGGPNDITRVKKTNTKGAKHVLRFNNLLPGDYTLCEKFFRGWKSNLAKKYGGTNLPSGNQCVDFTLQANGAKTFRVNNACPSGRRAPGT